MLDNFNFNFLNKNGFKSYSVSIMVNFHHKNIFLNRKCMIYLPKINIKYGNGDHNW